MKEVEAINNNLEWVKSNASETLYMEDIEFSVSKLFNILDLYNVDKKTQDKINALSSEMNMKR